MTIYATPNQPDTAFLTDAPTGLTGTLGFKIIDNTGIVVVAHTTTGITEISAGQYAKTFTPPTEAGDYLIVWDNGPTTVTEDLQVVWSVPPDIPASGYTPSLAEVAALIRARTKGGPNGQTELGTFDDTTKPTGSEVQSFIDRAVGHVALRLGPRVPDNAKDSAKTAVALRAAYQIERSYWPEQLESDNSTFRALRDEYHEIMADLQDTLEDADLATTSRVASQPVLSPTLSAYPEDLRPITPYSP